jgi:hypothetical protein
MGTDFPFGIEDAESYKTFLLELERVVKYPCGKRVLLTILSSCKIFETSTNFQNNIQAMREGERNIGLQILHSILDLDAGKTYTEMLRDYWNMYHNDTVLKQGGSNE